jgi:hypothetical protein
MYSEAGEFSDFQNSLIVRDFLFPEKDSRQGFLLNAYAFRDICDLWSNLMLMLSELFSTCDSILLLSEIFSTCDSIFMLMLSEIF